MLFMATGKIQMLRQDKEKEGDPQIINFATKIPLNDRIKEEIIK